MVSGLATEYYIVQEMLQLPDDHIGKYGNTYRNLVHSHVTSEPILPLDKGLLPIKAAFCGIASLQI